MDLHLRERKALVMGASRGLGRAIAKTLVDEGAKVVVCSRDHQRIGATANEIDAHGMVCDLSVEGAAAEVVEKAIQHLGGIDILVINTGGPPAGTFDTLTDQQWRTAFDGLWMSAVTAIRAALPMMRSQKHGRIILITSIAARETMPNLMLSNSLRAGLHGLVNALSKEVAADGITVNALMPGFQLTERLIELKVNQVEAAKSIPARRIGTAEDFASVAVFLASEQANYLTGQAICVDGGAMHSI